MADVRAGFIVRALSSAFARAGESRCVTVAERVARSASTACASARTSGARPSLVISMRLVVGVADVASLDQHRRRLGPAQDMEGRELVRPRAKLDPAGGPPQQPLGQPRRRFHLLAQRDVGQQGADAIVRLARQRPVRPIFGFGEARRLGARSDVGQRIDGRALGQRVGRAVHVERQEQARLQPARDAARCSSVRYRSSSRVKATRTRPRCSSRSASSSAMARVRSFSLLVPETPGAPGSRPPWPGSISTIGRPGSRASRTRTSVDRLGQVQRQAAGPGFADQRDRVADHAAS